MASDERGELIGRIEGSGRQLLSMIEDTLEVGRVAAGRAELQLERLRLPDLWSEIRRGSAGLSHHDDVRIEWSADPPDVALETDRRKLLVVVRNLLGNAVKFTHRGFIRAEVRVDDDAVAFQVSDTGIGIPASDRDRIFEMFRQLDSSDSRRYGGTGLGLYIVRRYVEQLGGAISVESEVGRGSTFTVRLPAIVADRVAYRAA
jgi:signal transduction histidine kinase